MKSYGQERESRRGISGLTGARTKTEWLVFFLSCQDFQLVTITNVGY